MMYCDGSSGPLLVRTEKVVEKLLAHVKNIPMSISERIEFFLANPGLRLIHCPDCMFYVKAQKTLEREDFLPLVSRLMLNHVRIEEKNFEYNCAEAGIKCSKELLKRAEANGISTPPCCLKVLTGLDISFNNLLISFSSRFE